MRYEVKHYETAHIGLKYDALICFEHDGLIKSMAYVPTCYPAHIVVESINNKLAMAYIVDSNSDMHALTLVHVLEITDKHTVLRRLLEQIHKEYNECALDSFELACDLGDMVSFINDIIY